MAGRDSAEDSGPLALGATLSDDQKRDRKKPLPYLRWYVTDYRASRNANKLSWEERGLYRELLDECWVEGCIPDDAERLADIARCPRGVMAEAWPNIRHLFAPVEGLDGMYVTSRRLELERSEEDARRVRLSLAGAKGAQARLSKAKQGLAPSSSSEQFRAEQSSSAASGEAAPEGASPSPDWRKVLSEAGNGPRPQRLTGAE